MRITIKVTHEAINAATQEAIDTDTPVDIDNTPIHQALFRMLCTDPEIVGNGDDPSTFDPFYVRWTTNGGRWELMLPKEARQHVTDFLNGRPVSPFTFEGKAVEAINDEDYDDPGTAGTVRMLMHEL